MLRSAGLRAAKKPDSVPALLAAMPTWAHGASLTLSPIPSSKAFFGCVKRWMRQQTESGNDPADRLSFIMANWKAICLALRAQKYSYVWVQNWRVFDPVILFQRPEYNKLVLLCADTLHLKTKQEQSREDWFSGDKGSDDGRQQLVDDATTDDFLNSLLR